MCGRFYIADEDETGIIGKMIDEAARKQQQIIGKSTVCTGEMAPGMYVPAVALGKSGAAGCFPMMWGFQMRGKRIFNTRLETAAEKPLFRESFQKRRCLLPMSHYFEWGWQERKVPSLLGDEAPMTEKRKVRYAIRPAEAGFVYLAGIYRYEPEEKLPSVSVLTCQPDESIAWLHDRMPVILSEKEALSFLLDDRTVQNRVREMVYRAG